jgi:molecular chaperone HscB
MAEATQAGVVCWHCGQPTGTEAFCPACGKIQPVSSGSDFFGVLGLPRRLALDASTIEQRFLTLSWKLHPDNFVRESERERALALERAALLNDAYRTLRDLVSRIEYVLEQEGIRREGEARQQVPPELLEEVFELNESLEELQSARQQGMSDAREVVERLREAAAGFEQRLQELDRRLQELAQSWDEAVSSGASKAARGYLEQMNELLNRRSYVRNLVARVTAELVEV